MRATEAQMDAYRTLCDDLTHMSRNERSVFDSSPVYTEALDRVIAGDYASALALVLPLRSVEGDVWRAHMADCGGFAHANFVA